LQIYCTILLYYVIKTVNLALKWNHNKAPSSFAKVLYDIIVLCNQSSKFSIQMKL